MEDRIYLLLKFGSEKNILDLYENGTVYLNTFEYFQRVENNFQGDFDEATIHLKNYKDPSKYTIELEDLITGKKFKHTPSALATKYKNLSPGNLYSMYCVRKSELIDGQKLRIEPKLKSFGTHCLLIFNPKKFKNRMVKALRQNELEYQANIVRYYDRKNYSGPLSLFHKSSEYSYQKEYRITVHNKKVSPIILKLGKLEDISKILKTDRIEHYEFSLRKGE